MLFDLILLLLLRLLILLLFDEVTSVPGDGIVRFGILKVFIQSRTCSLFDDFLSGMSGITESDVGNLFSLVVGRAYRIPLLLNRVLLLFVGNLL